MNLTEAMFGLYLLLDKFTKIKSNIWILIDYIVMIMHSNAAKGAVSAQ